MKQIKVAYFLILIIISLTGCSSFNEDDAEGKKETHSIAKDGISDIEAPEGCEIVSDMEKFQPVTEEQSYNSNTDMKTNFIVSNCTTDTGDVLYASFMSDWMVYFDKNNGRSGLLCSKPDCEHINTEICNGMFGFSASGIQYYNGDLYVVDMLHSSLVKIASDGTVRENVLQLYTKKGQEEMTTIEWFIHRGYIYYSYCLSSGMTEDTFYINNSNCLYRKAIDGESEAECIMALPVGSIQDHSWYGAGSYIYITTPNSVENGGQLYRYNTESGKLEWFKEFGNHIAGSAVRGNNIYYVQNDETGTGSKMYVYNTETKEKSVLFQLDNKSVHMIYDDDYIYLFYGTGDLGETCFGIWNWNGEHLTDIMQEIKETDRGTEINFIAGTDEKNIYLFIRVIGESMEDNPFGLPLGAYGVIDYIEKDDISDGEYEIKEWSEIKN